MRYVIDILLMFVPMFRTVWMNAYLIAGDEKIHVVEVDGEYVPELDVDEYQPDYLIKFRIFTFLGFGFFAKPISSPIPFDEFDKGMM